MTALVKESDFVSLKSIAVNYNLPYPFTKQIANDLVKADLLVTKGGATGGYKLARPADKISWKDVMIAVEGEPKFVKCLEKSAEKCPMLGGCPTAMAWKELYSVILDSLDSVKLSRFISSR